MSSSLSFPLNRGTVRERAIGHFISESLSLSHGKSHTRPGDSASARNPRL